MEIKYCNNQTVLQPCRLERFDFQIDPYIGCGHYCCYCYVLETSETDWHKEILVHQDIRRALSAELKLLPPQTIYMGNNTDPYQPCEAEHRQTRAVLETLYEAGFSASILTKSDLVLRDLDILEQMDNGAVSFSVVFSENNTHRLFETDTPETDKRINTLKILKEAGVKTGALVCPVIPYLTDIVKLIDMVESCADTVWVYGLSIPDRQGRNRKAVKAVLGQHYPDLKDSVLAAVDSRDHDFWKQLALKLQAVKDTRQIDLHIHL